MSERLRMRQVRKLVKTYLEGMSGEFVNLPDEVTERMTLIKGSQNSLYEVSPSSEHNVELADQLASIIPIHANGGGGFIVVGVDSRVDAVDTVGCAVDTEWLKYRLARTVDAKIDVVSELILGIRIVIVAVAGSSWPVSDPFGNLPAPWGTIDRSQWWQEEGTEMPSSAVPAETVQLIRELAPNVTGLSNEEVLKHIGAVTPQGKLTEIGAYLLAPTSEARFSVNKEPVEGETVLDQLIRVEDLLGEMIEPMNWGVENLPIISRPIPTKTMHDAIVYALTVADSNHSVDIDWEPFELDIAYTARIGQQRELLDLLRALGLVNPVIQGQPNFPIDGGEMIQLGLRPPQYGEGHIYLVGGEPDWNVIRFVRSVWPRHAFENELALRALYVLFREPYISTETLKDQLRIDKHTAEDILGILKVAAAYSEPLLVQHREGWILGEGARYLLGNRLPYLRPEKFNDLIGLDRFLMQYDTFDRADLVALQGANEEEAATILTKLEAENLVEQKSPGQYTLTDLR